MPGMNDNRLIRAEDVTDYWFRKYRKLPIEVDAVQMPVGFITDTPEGTLIGKKGDYLIRGSAGELHPCPEDIFDNTYERAEINPVGLGRFELEGNQVFSNSPELAKILRTVQVISHEYNPITDRVTYTAEFHAFAIHVEDLDPAPMYHLFLDDAGQVQAERIMND